MPSTSLQGAVTVELFEWPYESIELECPRLGAQGWAAVIISPPAAHVTLTPSASAAIGVEGSYSWHARALPVSWLELSSRSGTEMELTRAARVCSAHGVQVWADVQLDRMAHIPCCDDGSGSGTVRCSSLGLHSFGEGSCPASLRYSDTELTPTAFQPPCLVRNWDAPEELLNCSADASGASARLRSSDPQVRRVLAAHLNRLLSAGVAGFRVAGAALVGHAELDALLDELQPVHHAILRETSTINAPSGSKAADRPVVLVDVWPNELVRDPDAQPSPGEGGFWGSTVEALPPSLQAAAFLSNASHTKFASDHAWSLRAGDVWLCRAINDTCDETLQNFTDASWWSWPPVTFRHRRWRTPTEQPPHMVSRSINRPFLNAYAFWGGVCTQRICPEVVMSSFAPRLYEAATAWMMALPGGPPSVFSSYEWARTIPTRLNTTTGLWSLWPDTSAWVGPPRTASGRSAPVQCGAADASPFFDDGSAWNCEHRSALIGAMPRWRREVDGSDWLKHVTSPTPDSVAFARGVETRGRRRRHGWILVSRSPDGRLFDANAPPTTLWTGLPGGAYCDAAADDAPGHAPSTLQVGDATFRCPHVINVDWRGRISSNDVADRSLGVALHTGLAQFPVVGVSVGTMWVVLIVWLACMVIPMALWAGHWRRARVEVRRGVECCELEHNHPSPDVSGVPEPGKYGVRPSMRLGPRELTRAYAVASHPSHARPGPPSPPRCPPSPPPSGDAGSARARDSL